MRSAATIIFTVIAIIMSGSCREQEAVRESAPLATRPVRNAAQVSQSGDERTYPIQPNEPIPDFATVARAMTPRGSSLTVEEVTRQIKSDLAKHYVEGGERYYATETGRLVSDLPDHVRRLPPGEGVPLYAAYWLQEHAPVRIACKERNFAVVKRHELFPALAKGCLFQTSTAEDEDRLARSIARTFCLGGEFQVDHSIAPSNWKREKRIGQETYNTVNEYIVLLFAMRNRPEYCRTIENLDAVLDSRVPTKP